jgi:hypothetical protein
MSRPMRVVVSALLGGAALAFAVPAAAEDTNSAQPGATEVAPAVPAASPQPAPKIVPSAAAAKRPAAAPVHPASVQATAVIPPAPVPSKFSPPPDPRPALSLETDLQPLAPATPRADGPPPAAKAPAR